VKRCTVCLEEKPLTDYYKNHGKCKRCFIKRQQEKYDPVKNREKQLRRMYDIGLEDYDRMFIEQNGQCKLCGTTNPGGRQTGRGKVDVFFVDHCHSTGKVRGLLCNTCNRAIGQVGEKIAFFENAILYLKEHS
jgi:hypothetical protein